MNITSEQLKQDIAAFIDPSLASQLVDSYTHMQQRFYAGDWKPSELHGGQFCEAVARALYQFDTGIIEHELPGKICDLLLDRGTKLSVHHHIDSKHRNHFCRVLQTIYKLRSDRGVAHISGLFNANQLDAMLIVSSVKWLFGEFLLLTWKKDRSEVISIIETLVQFEHPLIHDLDGEPLILSNDLSAAEEVLVHLQHSQSGRLTRNELKQFIKKDQSTVGRAISRLSSSKEVRISKSGDVVITPLGQARARENIIPKLSAINGNQGSR